jgi:hypothetical protein
MPRSGRVVAGWIFPLFMTFLAAAGAPSAPSPAPDPVTAAVDGPPARARVGGKYRRLLCRIHVPQDVQQFQRFHDWGHWAGTEWQGHKNLPAGYWVYVYPDWYIWQDCNWER